MLTGEPPARPYKYFVWLIKQFHVTKHPIIKSFEPGEQWGYCYVDGMFFEQIQDAITKAE